MSDALVGTDDIGEPSRKSDGDSGQKRSLGARISLFYRQVISEMRKVIWPTRKELITYTTVVIVFVTVMALFIAAIDYVFGQGVLWVFGR